MTVRSEQLTAALQAALGEQLVDVTTVHDEVTAVVRAEHLLAAAATLRDAPGLAFVQLIDLCGVDYSAYGIDESGVAADGGEKSKYGGRYAVVYHLLSLKQNWRLRLRTFAA